MSKFEEIIRLSGYSRATVSRVINNSRHVNDETRTKILQIMKQLDYVPNRNAVSLSTGRTKQIGIVMTNLHEVLLGFMNSFVDIAMDYGYQTIIYTTRSDATTELQAFEDLRSKRVDALVIVTCVNDPQKLVAYCEYGPIVSWQRMEEGGIPSIAMDQAVGYALAIQHLIERGHTRIANLFGRTGSLNTISRRLAYEQKMKEHQLPVHTQWYRYEQYSVRDGEAVLTSLLTGQEAPSAILCANDYLAAGVVSAAGKLGIDIPQQLAVVGFDDIELSHALGITTVRNPILEQARNAFFLIKQQLDEKTIRLHELDYELIVRSTT